MKYYKCIISGMQYQALWEKLFSNFESIGIGTYEVYFGRNPQLFREIGANRIPQFIAVVNGRAIKYKGCLLYTSPSPRDGLLSRMPSSA